MSTRRTTRSTAQQGPTITDHFLQSRNGGSVLPGKTLGDEVETVKAPSSKPSAKRTLFSSSRVQVQLNEVEEEAVPLQTMKPEVKSRPARALFSAVPKKVVKVEKEIKVEQPKEEVKKKEIKVEQPKEEVKEKAVEPVRSIIPTEKDVAAPKANGRKQWGDLQAELAKRGAARIDEQVKARKLEQIAEREAYLKSPTKMVQTTITGGSPPKRARKGSKETNKKRTGPVKVLPPPDFVLPSYSVEKSKVRPERERSEDRETSPQETSITNAPRGYGSSLMNDEVKKSLNVVLPASYKELQNVFNTCEMIISTFDTSGKTLTFSSLSQGVKKAMRKDFSLDRFAQLIAVYPQAYTVEVKKLTCVGDRMGGARAGRWEHVIKANLHDDLTSFVADPKVLEESAVQSEPILTCSPRKNLFSPMKGRTITTSSGIRIPASPRKPASPAKPILREVVMDTRKKLEGWRRTCRQQSFRCLLARRVIAAHEEFMKERKLDLPATSAYAPIHFHPEFTAKQELLCPPIEKATIDKIPEEENAGPSHQGMGEFLKMASDTVTVLPKGVESALFDLRSPEKKTVSSRGVPLSPAKFAAEKPKTMTLLERIKAKQAAQAAAEMRRDPALEAKMADLGRLVTDKILYLIFNIYQTQSRTSIAFTNMIDRIVDSKGISQDKASSLLSRLADLLPTYFTIVKNGVGKYIQVTDNSPNANEIVLSSLKKELEVCKTRSAATSS